MEDVREQRDGEHYDCNLVNIDANTDQNVDLSDARLVGMPGYDSRRDRDTNYDHCIIHFVHFVHFNVRDSRVVLVQGQDDSNDINDDDNDDNVNVNNDHGCRYHSINPNVIVNHDLRDSREVLGLLG